MSNAMEILNLPDSLLKSPAEIVLYDRAALLLGFDKPPPEFALSRDVDVVLHTGQAEALPEKVISGRLLSWLMNCWRTKGCISPIFLLKIKWCFALTGENCVSG